MYYPIIGYVNFLQNGEKQKNDCLSYKREFIKQNPNLKFIATNLFNKILLIVCDPQIIKEVVTNHESFQKAEMIIFNDLLFQKGLLFTYGSKWKNQRKMIGHQFKFENLAHRINFMKQTVSDIFRNQIQTDKQTQILDICCNITGTIVSQTFFGNQIKDEKIKGENIIHFQINVIGNILNLSFQGLWTNLKSGFINITNSKLPQFLLSSREREALNDVKLLREHAYKQIQTRIEQFHQNEKLNNRDFLQTFIQYMKENPDQITIDEIIDQYLTFFFAGTDTTAHLVALACYALAIYPDVQQELRKEIQSQISEFDLIEASDLQNFNKLNAFIQESLRIYTPVDGYFWRIVKQDMFLGQFFVRSGTLLDIGILPSMLSEAYFKGGQEFDISKWLDGSKNQLVPFSYIPFSAGGRNCIGQHMAQIEAKLMIIYLLLNYRIIEDKQTTYVRTYRSLYGCKDWRLVQFQNI